MKRKDLFKNIHKGLRAMLFEEALALQQTDFSDKDQSAGIYKRITGLIDFFKKHADAEDRIVLPFVVDYEPAIVTLFNEEHVSDKELSRELSQLAEKLKEEQDADRREEAGSQLCRTFNSFLVFNLEHMAREEEVLNPILWRYYSDDQLAQITRKIMEAQSIEDRFVASRWMLRGLNNKEITGWMLRLKEQSPQQIFNRITDMAASELDNERWTSISDIIFMKFQVA